MTRYMAADIVAAAERQNQALVAELDRLTALAEQHRGDLAALRREHDAAWEHLTGELLPGLDAGVLDAAADRLALRSISAAHVRAEIAADRRQVADELATIDADPDYVHREGLLNEQAIRVAELDDLIRPLAEARAACEAAPLWTELIAVGYDTPNYAVKWFMLRYYHHWKHGDLALASLQARFPGAQRFADVRAKAEEYARAENELVGERTALVVRGRRISELVARRERLVARRETEAQRFLALARGRVRAHLAALEPDDVVPLIAGSRAAELGYKRVLGVAAKQRYLEALGKELVAAPRSQLERGVGKNRRTIAKMQRPKHAYAEIAMPDFDRRFAVRADAWTKRRERYDRTRRQIVEFHDYGRADLGRDFLWWDVMTDGKLDGDFIREVAEHRAHHGERAAYRDDDTHGAAVAAVAGLHARDPDDGLMHDGS